MLCETSGLATAGTMAIAGTGQGEHRGVTQDDDVPTAFIWDPFKGVKCHEIVHLLKTFCVLFHIFKQRREIIRTSEPPEICFKTSCHLFYDDKVKKKKKDK